MPGIKITTAVRTGPSASRGGPGTRYFITGQSDKGPTGRPGEPGYVLASSLAELRSQVGGLVPYGFVDDDARVFFEELGDAGADLAFARVAGNAAAAAFTILDTAAALDAVRVEAVSVGTWANAGGSEALSVQPVAGTVGTITINVFVNGERVESFPNNSTNAEIAAALTKSAYVRGIDLGPVGGALPAAAGAPVALAGGNSDSAAVTAADLTDAFERFTDDLGIGVIAVPGYPADQVAAGLQAHAQAHSRIFYSYGDVDDDDVDAVAGAAALLNSDGGEFGGYLWPALTISNGPRSTKDVTPGGYAAAQRARAMAVAGGPWEVPAGDLAASRSSSVIAPNKAVTDARADELDAAHVSVIRTIDGRAELYGYRSLFVVAHPLDEDPYELLKERDVLNWLVDRAGKIMRGDVFRVIDGKGRRLAQLKGELLGLCQSVEASGGLFPIRDDVTGEVIDPAFSVETDAALNTRATLGQNRLRAAMTVRTSPTAASVELLLTKASLTAGV